MTLKDRGPAWEIHTTDDGAALTHKVVEVGEDYVVVRDEAGAVETRIPGTGTRAVVQVRRKAK